MSDLANKLNEGKPDVETPPVESKEQPNPPADQPAVKAAGDNVDEFGYHKEKAEEGKEAPKAAAKKEEPAPEPKKVEKPATGYGAEPPKVEDEPAAPAEKPEIPLEFAEELKDLSDEEQVGIREFAKKNSFSKEQVKALGDLRRDNIKKEQELATEREAAIRRESAKIRNSWHTELKNDPAFGGEKFDRNIARAERVLEEFMPQTKKSLTEHKGMLPPYVMRDLANLADHLYSSEKLVMGEPKVPAVKDEELPDAHLSFYT